MMRSRSRSSRSAANRRGSWPAFHHMIDRMEYRRAASSGEGIDYLIEQPVVGEAQQRNRAVVAQASVVEPAIS